MPRAFHKYETGKHLCLDLGLAIELTLRRDPLCSEIPIHFISKAWRAVLSFRTSRRLNFGDCDPSGIAYFPSYLHILVGVLEEFFEEIGAGWPGMIAERRIGVPTVRLDLTFKKPGFHGNLLDFEVRVVRVGTTSLDLEHAVSCDGQLLWTAVHRVVATSLGTHKAHPWPDEIKAALTYYLEKTNARDPAT